MDALLLLCGTPQQEIFTVILTKIPVTEPMFPWLEDFQIIGTFFFNVK